MVAVGDVTNLTEDGAGCVWVVLAAEDDGLADAAVTSDLGELVASWLAGHTILLVAGNVVQESSPFIQRTVPPSA